MLMKNQDKSILSFGSKYSLLALRLYLGMFYYQTGMSKVSKDGFGMGWMPNMVSQIEAALPDVYPWYHWFLENVVLSFPMAFTLMVAWGEFLLGLALLFGFANRLAGLLGAFMAFNFALMSGRDFWLPHFDTTLACALLAIGLAQAGRNIGLDQFLSKKFPQQNLLW